MSISAKTTLIAIAAIGIMIAGCTTSNDAISTSARSASASDTQEVNCRSLTVIDGDTVRCDNVSYRLVGSGAPNIAGFNTPEPSRYNNAKCAEEARLGDLATARMREIVAEGVVLHAFPDRDRFNRGLGYLARADGTTAGDVMLREGLAQVWPGGKGWCN